MGITTPVADATILATEQISGEHYPKNIITDGDGNEAIGDVGASPGANTILGRLKAAVDALTGATPAGENHIGQTSMHADVFPVTLTLDTNIYADGDVLAVTATLTNLVRVTGGQVSLQSIVVIDEDDQGVAFDLVFLSANNSIGTINGSVSISDANARDVLGIVSILASDFKDLGGVRIATVYPPGLILEAAGGSRDIYLAAISRGTGTYTASGIKLRLGLALA